MMYHLNETSIKQLVSWSKQIDKFYSEKDALELNTIIINALKNAYLSESDVYKLLEILPRILPTNVTEEKRIEEEDNADWSQYIDEHRMKYKKEMEELYKLLSNWVFLQSAVYHQKSVPKKKQYNNVALSKNRKTQKNILNL